MKSFHPLSFAFGLASGLIVLAVVIGAWNLATTSSGQGPGNFRRNNGLQQAGGRFDLSRMAERLGMTEEELQAELDSGKTFQEIAAGRSVEMPSRTGTGGLFGGRGMRSFGASSASGTSLLNQSGAAVTTDSSSPPSTLQQ